MKLRHISETGSAIFFKNFRLLSWRNGKRRWMRLAKRLIGLWEERARFSLSPGQIRLRRCWNLNFQFSKSVYDKRWPNHQECFTIKLCMPQTPSMILPLQHEVPSLKCIGFTGRLSPPSPDQSLSHFSEKHEVPSLKCIGFTGPLINIYYSRLSRDERYYSEFRPRRK